MKPDPPTSEIPLAPKKREPRRRLSSVWLIPLIAIALGASLVWRHYQSQGVLIRVTFETGDGVVAGKTKVQCRSVSVGTVDSVSLNADLQGVVTTIRMDKDALRLLREDSRFWIVRPRVGGAGISGLGTIVSGNFIELDPGVSPSSARSFAGLENPPVTPLTVPGLRIALVADEAGSLGSGSPVSYKGITVGRIESREFQAANNKVSFAVFIEADYADFVVSNTRFWNVTGLDLDVSADGFRLRTGSLGSLVAGGVEFGIPEGERAGTPVEDGRVFRLHDDSEGSSDVAINPTLTYMLLFEDSVRGLRPQAPVEFRGIRVGSVSEISFDLYRDEKHRVPVLIQIDPNLIALHAGTDRESGLESMAVCVEEGLRATLKTGSLLTGQLFVDLDFQEDAPPAATELVSGYDTLPTASSGFARIEDKLMQVMNKIEALPVESMLDNAATLLATLNEATLQAEGTLNSLSEASRSAAALLAAKSTQAIPAGLQGTLAAMQSTLEGLGENSVLYRDLYRTLDELRDSLHAITQLAASVERKPNSLIFGRGKSRPTAPQAKR